MVLLYVVILTPITSEKKIHDQKELDPRAHQLSQFY